MERDVGFVLLFLLFCLSFAFSHGNPYNLNGDQTDACFQPSQKATAECLQELIESYYGKYFTKYCPDFPQVLAESRCTGCPWDRLDPEKINPDIAEKYRAASNNTGLIHEPGANCRVSKFVEAFATYRGVANFVVGWAIAGTIPILLSTSAIVQHTEGSTGLTRPSFFGWEVPEWMFMSAVWISFNVGKVFLSISEEYYRYCETAASNLALVIARNLSYLLMIYYSLSRCRQFPFLRPENNQGPEPETNTAASETTPSLNGNNRNRRSDGRYKSWDAVITDTDGKFLTRAVIFCFVYGYCAILLSLCSLEIFGIVIPDHTSINSIRGGPPICSLPSIGAWTRALGIAKLTFEPVVYAVYSVGPSSKSQAANFIRYFALVLIYGFYCFIASRAGSLYQLTSESYLVWRVPLSGTVLPYTAVNHVMVVSCFGFLEAIWTWRHLLLNRVTRGLEQGLNY